MLYKELTCFFLLSNALLASSISDEAAKYLLPGNLRPEYYQLTFDTFMENFVDGEAETFVYEGYVVIYIVPTEDDVTRIQLHSYQTITINTATFTPVYSGFGRNLGSGIYDNETQILSFDVPKGTIKKDEPFWMDVRFIGRHTDPQNGFFKIKTSNESGDPDWILATHLSPIYARRVFPCFDEPKYRTLFEISVSIETSLYKKGYHVMTNTAVQNVVQTSKRTYFYFVPAPLPIPTFLIAMVVSNYVPTEPAKFNSSYPELGTGALKNFTTWGEKTRIERGDGQILQIAGPALLEIFTENFNIGFGYDKLDQVCIYKYRGGMENWGLVLYTARLFDNDPIDALVLNLLLISHELGHQWFGDLVTVHWWSDLWLKEGFATYLGHHGADQIRVPGLDTTTMKLKYDFVIEKVQKLALKNDAGHNVALTHEVYTPAEILSRFNFISYPKGASVIRMWSHILGVETFYAALELYLRDASESVATPEDLLAAFDAVANKSASDLQGQPPSHLFKCWHLQPSYPVLIVNRSTDNKGAYILTQKRFYKMTPPQEDNLKWDIPISYSTSKSHNFDQTYANSWLKATDDSQEITLPEPVEWIVVNNQETGYYRVLYDQENYNALIDVLSNNDTKNQIHEINRAQIMDDTAAFCQSTEDYLHCSTLFRVLNTLQTETSYYPFASALNGLEFLNAMLKNDSIHYPIFQEYVLSLIQNQYDSLKQEPEAKDDYPKLKLRKLIYHWACMMNETYCIEQKITLKTKQSSSDLSEIGYCSKVKKGGNPAWKGLWHKFKASVDPVERNKLLTGLGCATDSNIAIKFIKKTISSKSVFRDERYSIFKSLYNADPLKSRFVLSFIINNWDKMVEKHGDMSRFRNLLLEVSYNMATDSDISMMDHLVKKLQSSTSHETRAILPLALKAQENVMANNLWMQKKSSEIFQWLKENVFK